MCGERTVAVQCSAVPGERNEEVCDGIDNDCNGLTDEGFDADHDGFRLCDDDCDDHDWWVNPAAEEYCDGKDNDCDGLTDVDFAIGEDCRSGVGECARAGRTRCVPGPHSRRIECEAEPGRPANHEACDGLDNDCDGITDEEVPDLGGACEAKDVRGECARGTLRCEDGAVRCVPGSPAWGEFCDGLDNDCDGETDETEDLPVMRCRAFWTQGACQEGLTGPCMASLRGGVSQTCLPARPSPEVCDGVDNDCDGQVDEDAGVPCYAGEAGTQLPELVGECRHGRHACVDGLIDKGVCVGEILPEPESCDTLDNDCDGKTDEDTEELGQRCTVGLGLCEREDTWICTPEGLFCPADRILPPLAYREGEVYCNEVDEDCDGLTDENWHQSLGAGWPDVERECGHCGVCLGVMGCSDDRRSAGCRQPPPPDWWDGEGPFRNPIEGLIDGEYYCDGLDNDCDCETDEDFPPADPPEGVSVHLDVHGEPAPLGSVCTGRFGACVHEAGFVECGPDHRSTICSVEPGGTEDRSSVEVCDGLDNDCDGEVDDGNPGGGGECPTGRPGACATGLWRCVNGALVCEEVVDPSEERCDGVDNDCDGATDEDQPGRECGVGPCRRAVPGCVDGVVPECVPGQPSPELCNGADDDCDGVTDEDAGQGTPCDTGLPGVCADGTFFCDGGVPACPPDLGPFEELCNGLDDDCDGAPDQDFGPGLPCALARPDCPVEGVTVCTPDGDGTECVWPGGEAPDELCNGVDDDCDGVVDEWDPGGGGECVTGLPGLCGVGVERCEDGQVVCGDAYPPDAADRCNGLDTDCDGLGGSLAEVCLDPDCEDQPVCVGVPEAPVLPEYDTTVSTPFSEITDALAEAVQTDLEEGELVTRRVGVLRGRVAGRDGLPLPGVEVSLLRHPKLGHTVSRADGEFDLVVNGGQELVVRYDRRGYLPVHRRVYVPWNDFAWVPDVVMTRPDRAATDIELSADTETWQVHRASVVADADGERQATLLFPPGTMARLARPGPDGRCGLTAAPGEGEGEGRGLALGRVRATEFTVGPEGPQAMPATLPPTSLYTYAVELDFDEAEEAGACRVGFRTRDPEDPASEVAQSVPLYVDNYRGFPVGTRLPVGLYDRGLGMWIPADNARVLRVAGVEELPDGRRAAILELGTEDDEAEAAALGITDDERVVLAGLYPENTEIWRAALTHFSVPDVNPGWAFRFIEDHPLLAAVGGIRGAAGTHRPAAHGRWPAPDGPDREGGRAVAPRGP